MGKFRMSWVLVKERGWGDLLPLMGNFFIINTEHHLHLAEITYTAYSQLFDKIAEGDPIPLYELEIALMPDAPAVIKAYRLDRMKAAQ